jgi:hypothetical protein
MCIKLKCSLLLLLYVGMFSVAKAQQKKIDNDMAKFFVGNWSGEGQFANGKKIAADVSFSLSVDSSSLIYVHADKPPNVYKATSAWGIDKLTRKFVTHIISNFSGHPEFTSEGWKSGQIIFTNSANIPARGVFYQHFICERISERSI